MVSKALYGLALWAGLTLAASAQGKAELPPDFSTVADEEVALACMSHTSDVSAEFLFKAKSPSATDRENALVLARAGSLWTWRALRVHKISSDAIMAGSGKWRQYRHRAASEARARQLEYCVRKAIELWDELSEDERVKRTDSAREMVATFDKAGERSRAEAKRRELGIPLAGQ